MSQKKEINLSIGVCSIILGSSAISMKAKRLLEQNGISATVKKATTRDGCVYTVNLLCAVKSQAESILRSHGIQIKGYL